ncbi:hypothetical protein CTI12_AA505520 [Artemisia annua]|uniref:Uncharacterized protein n=1 Tax=Artemisia annua TaxID=35608 RepID=A0A2U1LCL7_ARTAN|nr:hypothetical protein CTI12_AA505520 [Artemisia annua]
MVGRAVVALGSGGSDVGWRVAEYRGDWRRVGGRNKVNVARSIFWNKKKSCRKFGRNIFQWPDGEDRGRGFIGSVVLYTAQGKFHESTTYALDYVVSRSNDAVHNLNSFLNELVKCKPNGLVGKD